MSDNEDGKDTRVLSLADVNRKLDDVLDKIANLVPGNTEAPRNEHASVADQVNEAIAKAKADEQAGKEKEELHNRVAALEALREEKPKNRNKFTKFNWGGDD